MSNRSTCVRSAWAMHRCPKHVSLLLCFENGLADCCAGTMASDWRHEIHAHQVRSPPSQCHRHSQRPMNDGEGAPSANKRPLQISEPAAAYTKNSPALSITSWTSPKTGTVRHSCICAVTSGSKLHSAVQPAKLGHIGLERMVP